MADSNFARNRMDVPEFADDDPLAELARIVGYDERLVPKSTAAERREPAFNLEDELLHEFERYEAPRPHQPEVKAAEVMPVVADRHPVHSSEPSLDYSESSFSGIAGESAVPAQEALEPSFAEEVSFELEQSLAAIPAVDEPNGALTVADLSAVDAVDLARERQAMEGSDASSVDAQVPSFEMPEAQYVAPAVEPVQDAEHAAPALDLSDELELTLSPAAVADADPRAGRKPIYTPGFRMPLANFHPAKDTPRNVSARHELPSRVEPAFSAAAASNDVVASVTQPVFQGQAEELNFPQTSGLEDQAPAAELSSVHAPLPTQSALSDLDVADPAARAGSVAVAKTGPAGPVISEPRFDLPFELKDDPFSLGLSSISQRQAVSAQSAPEEAVLDDDFELALEDLELDLTDMLFEDEVHVPSQPAPAVAATPAHASAPAPVAAPVSVVSAPVEAPRFTASWSPVARVVPTPAITPVAPASQFHAAVAPPQPPQTVVEPEVAFESVSDHAFDPALIAETDEQLEPVIELHVPELQLEEEEPAAEFQSDYDYDIDAELASLLQPAVSETVEAGEHAEPAAPAQPQPQQTGGAYLDLDDFERALEEDFRRSLTAPLPPQSHMDGRSDQSGGRFYPGARRPVAAFAVPLALLGVIVAGGSIGYAIFGGEGSSMASNKDPIVIAADTDPVKVLPKDPGGKTVPNQDKAVYDRVAGQVPEAPKQEALISTSEEPVDVVQKTLMSDQFPLDGEDMAEVADVSYREDRLAPDVEQAGIPAEAGQQPVAVMPRRVKTMIVRPDGTLVEQEIAAAPEPVAPAAVSAEPQKVPAASVKSVEVASIPDAPATQSPDAPASNTASVVPVSADASAPVMPAAPSAGEAAISAPVPTTRPAQQPANVVAAVSSQGTVTPAPAAQAAPVAAPAAAGQTQVASLAPGDYVIQIASLPTAADAEKSYKNLSAKFSSVIGGRGVDIREAQVAGKGTFYRVRIPAGSKNDAVALCERYRAAGGSCLVAK